VRLVGREHDVRDNSGNGEYGRGPGVAREHGCSFGSTARGVSRVGRHVGESLNLSLGSKGDEDGEALREPGITIYNRRACRYQVRGMSLRNKGGCERDTSLASSTALTKALTTPQGILNRLGYF
jgi:hypothetical protein